MLSGSVAVGYWFGVHVRIHASLIILTVCNLLFANSSHGMGIRDALTSTIILFGIILLHEFGHCVAARSVGGRADEILLWPLGGLAYISTPRRPWPSFVGTAGGPLVNLFICAVTGGLMLILSKGHVTLPWNPMLAFGGDALTNDMTYLFVLTNTVIYYLWWIYTTSLMLFFFNLLPIYPLDGGHILQTILWPKFGYYNSMNFACVTGMIAAGFMVLVGLMGNFFLIFLGIAGFSACYQTRMNLRETSDQAWEDSRFHTEGSPLSLPRLPNLRARKKPAGPLDDKFTLRDLNPFERIARARRKKQFERLMRDD